MANLRQFRSLMSGLSLGGTTATLVMVFVLSVTTAGAQAQSFQVLHTFSGPDGAQPVAGLTMSRGGQLYGTLLTGHGGSNWGGAYQLRRAGTGWILNTLYIFDGTLLSRAVFGPEGLLYGTAPNNLAGLPYGYIYSLRPAVNACTTALCSWNESLVYGFMGSSDGGAPLYGDLIFDNAGKMYGTTSIGGNNNNGVVYTASHSGSGWMQQPIYTFAGSPDGSKPYNAVIFDTAGNLYGTTAYGGATGNGAVFELSPSGSGWTEQVIYSFQGGNDGSFPAAGLTFDQAGNLYGATASGGSGGGGTVFELSPNGGSWTHTVINNFTGAAMCGPWGTLTLQGGNLYGTTYCDGATGDGNVWELASSGGGWTYSSVYDFTGGNDGKAPYCSVIFDAAGDMFGVASIGGQHQLGTVWEITP